MAAENYSNHKDKKKIPYLFLFFLLRLCSRSPCSLDVRSYASAYAYVYVAGENQAHEGEAETLMPIDLSYQPSHCIYGGFVKT